MNRRHFISTSGLGALTFATSVPYACSPKSSISDSNRKGSVESFFEISLAEWSFHKALRAKKMTNMDFAAKAKK